MQVQAEQGGIEGLLRGDRGCRDVVALLRDNPGGLAHSQVSSLQVLRVVEPGEDGVRDLAQNFCGEVWKERRELNSDDTRTGQDIRRNAADVPFCEDDENIAAVTVLRFIQVAELDGRLKWKHGCMPCQERGSRFLLRKDSVRVGSHEQAHVRSVNEGNDAVSQMATHARLRCGQPGDIPAPVRHAGCVRRRPSTSPGQRPDRAVSWRGRCPAQRGR